MQHDARMHVFLETERLVLRRFTEDDVDHLVELDGDPQVMHFINGGRPTPRAEIETDVLPAFLGYYERFAGYGFWAAVEKSSGQFVGWFHFRPAKAAPPDEVELGYRLRRSAWGKGYATEGSRALIDKGVGHCAKKLNEEAFETGMAAVQESKKRLISESADLLYHLLVLLKVRGVAFGKVEAELAKRTKRSGHKEKASRRRR